MPALNDPLPDTFLLTDYSGAPITGATLINFTATARKLNVTPAVTAPVTITEATGGEYDTVFTPSDVGMWRLSVSYDDGTVQRGPFVETYEVTTESAVQAAELATAILGSSLAGYSVNTAGGQLARLGTGQVTELVVVALAGNVRIFKGDDYLTVDGRALAWTTSDAATWPDLTGATIALTADFELPANAIGTPPTFTATGVIDTATGANKAIHVDLPSSATIGAAIPEGRYNFSVNAVLSDASKVTLVAGTLQVLQNPGGA